MTEAQITEGLHIMLILVLAINAYITWLIHGRQVENLETSKQNSQKLDNVLAPKQGSNTGSNSLS